MTSSLLSHARKAGIPAPAHRGRMLAALLTAPFLAQADATIANVATPSIHAGLGASGAALQLDISGVSSTTVTIGGAIGVAAVGALYLSLASPPGVVTATHAYAVTTAALGVAALVTVLTARLATRRSGAEVQNVDASRKRVMGAATRPAGCCKHRRTVAGADPGVLTVRPGEGDKGSGPPSPTRQPEPR